LIDLSNTNFLITKLLFMIKKVLSIIFIVSFTFIFAQEAYYNNVNLSLSGIALKGELNTKITTTHTNMLVYTPGVWEACKATDVNPTNVQEVLLIYGWEDGSDGTIVNDRERGIDNNGGGQGEWNREHVFPRSLGNPNLEFVGPGADAHSIRPSDASLNSTRSNRKFGLGSGNSGSSIETYVGNKIAWYPGDEWKGDVARMMMYMYVRYGDQCLPSAVGVGSGTFTPDDMIDLFLNWNVEDPVSDFEKQRNIFHENTSNTYAQGNRNPFIDNPYLATRIWGGDSAEDIWGIYTSSDTEAPSVPANVTLNNITTFSIDVSWTASTDNIGVTGYEVFVDGNLITITSSTSITISGLDSNTMYSFTVLAKDLVNNKSAESPAVFGTTLEDTEAPSIPINLVVSDETDSSFKITWNESTDNTAVTGYDIYLDGIFNGTTAIISYTITNLSVSTSYAVTVLAKDAVNNQSEQSSPVNGTTTDGSSNGATELFFSEYVEGSANNKALEIANVTNSTINLSGYTIKRQTNGGGAWLTPLDLSSGSVTSIVPGDVFVVINGNADNATLIAEADISVPNMAPDYGAPVSFNGNDPVGLFKNDVLIDIIGVFNGGSSNFAQDITLRRRSDISGPNVLYDHNEWESFAKNTVDDIGQHTSTLNVNDLVYNSIKMFPNPVNNNFLYFNSNQDIDVIIYDILGKQVLIGKITSNKKYINVSGLNKGIYIVKLNSNNGIITKKLIKQ
jgi:endonuclease I/chitodextrinase